VLVAGLSLLAAAWSSSAATATTKRTEHATFLRSLGHPVQVGSTVPANGDVNPYGVTVVATTSGLLTAGDVLVSNFNNKGNVQGTGTTIVEVSPSGTVTPFATIPTLPAGQCPGGVGLSTALGLLPGGWVVVGSLPTSAGGALPSGHPVGCLIVLNNQGQVAETWTNPDIVGPWDMAVQTSGNTAALFVSNALGGNTATKHGVPVAGMCTVVRLNVTLGSVNAPPQLSGTTVVGRDFPWVANKTALVLAPTGLALGKNGTLYVDNTQTNSVSAIPEALTRTSAVTATHSMISKGGALNAPLGLTAVPNGDLIVVNGNDGNAIELSTSGRQLGTRTLVKGGAGDLFGLAPTPSGTGLYFVNDGTNALDVANPR